MQTLFTNSRDLIGHNFKHEFKSKLKNSKGLIIASGYFGESLITEYQDDIVELSRFGICKILIGMVFHGGITRKQKDALIALDGKLRGINKDNGVYIAVKPYHGKIYFFCGERDSAQSLYLGSSNFSEEGFASRYECTALIQNVQTKKDAVNYLKHLFDVRIAKPVGQVELRVKSYIARVTPINELLDDYKIQEMNYPDTSEVLGTCSIPLRVDEQPSSSLNLYFDKGRKNSSTKLYTPRPWYEVEITSSVNDRKSSFYPKKGNFIAYAKDKDNYYKFNMVCCSDNGKAISTSHGSGGRATLGKFIKGKLESRGLLTIGERITSDILLEYGRGTIDFMKVDEGVYIIDF